MTMHPLPPQAYTKDILQRAYTWLLSQSPSIKELASSQDMLVSLYLKAQRNGEASLEAPSIQNFKQELKSLANMMGDFSTSPAGATSTSNSTANTNINTNSSTNSTVLAGLDSHSTNVINEVRTALNLSSDIEALRALIALGHKQFKKI